MQEIEVDLASTMQFSLTLIVLTIEAINPKTNQPLSNYRVDFRRVSSAGGNTSVGQANTSSNGVATLTITYPNDTNNAYAYYAKPACKGNQTLASNPLQLTVGLNTTLLLSVSRQPDSNTHTFMVRLAKSDRSGLSSKLLKLKLNDTEYDATTNSLGNATWTINLSPQTSNTATIYNVVISFDGDGVSTATASMTLLNGTSYPVCTTTQYYSGSAVGYEPCSNSSSITVEPQKTTGATTLMNTEHMQADAL